MEEVTDRFVYQSMGLGIRMKVGFAGSSMVFMVMTMAVVMSMTMPMIMIYSSSKQPEWISIQQVIQANLPCRNKTLIMFNARPIEATMSTSFGFSTAG